MSEKDNLNPFSLSKSSLRPTITKITSSDGSVSLFSNCGSILESNLETKSCGFVVDTKPDLSVSAVLSWLFISSQDVPQDFNLCQKYQISAVLSLMPGFELPFKLNHMTLDLYDEPSFNMLSSDLVEKGLDFISEEKRRGGKILVHCNAGLSRSPTLVLLYLVRREALSFEEAWNLVKRARESMRPNEGFLKQLKSLK